MSFDPRHEDYFRLSLRFSHTLDDMPSQEAIRAFTSFGRRFARERDSLPQTDADRAFHLVAKAATLIDYELPFVEDEQRGHELIDQGRRLLTEALSLDPSCADAERMLAASSQQSFEGFYEYLCIGEPEVQRRCSEERDAVSTQGRDERAVLARDLAMRPYLRWLANLASQALICGHNRKALHACTQALHTDPTDAAGVRLTAACAFAKLEDAAGLDTLIAQYRALPHDNQATNAWFQLARIALAYKAHDMTTAHAQLSLIVSTYPHACAALIRQQELPEGVFARLAVAPLSEDELIVALSEMTILLQEGREQDGRGSFGAWIAQEAERFAQPWEAQEILDAKRFAQELADRRDAPHNEGNRRS